MTRIITIKRPLKKEETINYKMILIVSSLIVLFAILIFIFYIFPFNSIALNIFK